jgi:hypothetical protein
LIRDWDPSALGRGLATISTSKYVCFSEGFESCTSLMRSLFIAYRLNDFGARHFYDVVTPKDATRVG